MIIKNLVFAGGGFKGISYIGAYKYLYDNSLLNELKSLAGTSIGALFSFFIVCGFTPKELKGIFIEFVFEDVFDIHLDNLIMCYGLDTAQKFRDILSIILAKKVDINITFEELFAKTGKELNIIVSNITRIRYDILNHKTSGNMKVLDAVMMSMNLPVIFAPYSRTISENISNTGGYICRESLQKEYIVDGGLYNNYPIDLYQNELEYTLGYDFIIPDDNGDCCGDITDYFVMLINSFINFSSIEKYKSYRKNTVYLPIGNEYVLMLNADIKTKNTLIRTGYNYTRTYFMKLRHFIEQEQEQEQNHEESTLICDEIINDIINKVETYIEVRDLLTHPD
jgi:NTE family protein